MASPLVNTTATVIVPSQADQRNSLRGLVVTRHATAAPVERHNNAADTECNGRTHRLLSAHSERLA
jgi:hypothetical protein